MFTHSKSRDEKFSRLAEIIWIKHTNARIPETVKLSLNAILKDLIGKQQKAFAAGDWFTYNRDRKRCRQTYYKVKVENLPDVKKLVA